MLFTEFKNQIKETYKKKFPDSFCRVTILNGFGKTMWINCYLSKDASEVSGGIIQNDMLHISFMIELPDDFNIEDDLPEEMVLEATHKSYTIIPENRCCVYGSRRLSFRKTTGNSDKIIKSFNNFVNKLYNSLKEDISSGNIHEDFSEIVANKVR